jgi:Uma2 family endonuclease
LDVAEVATEADLLRTPKDGRKYELVDGEIRVSPAGNWHEFIGSNLLGVLRAFVIERQLGFVLGSSAGFRLPGGNVRSPDVSFVANGRYPDNKPSQGYPDFGPDLAVEILSPDDRPRDVLDKVGEYLQAGVRAVWVIDPRKRRAVVHRSLSEVVVVESDGVLEGEDVVPGFRCPLAEILG